MYSPTGRALSFLSSVLKYDPDQNDVRQQYKQLKEVRAPSDRSRPVPLQAPHVNSLISNTAPAHAISKHVQSI